jgi:hypothetical protein
MDTKQSMAEQDWRQVSIFIGLRIFGSYERHHRSNRVS